ncbi:hypothetical protein HPB49_006224 [Dermacentor silvarum]|uniref:Uncharacterized protein n=1 Tax=Dermacentor silvarum TaxID=543639 RepID=A0ACB8DVV3_DERSI|nr:hypothetical protein HPB49_006224 [Dermacentor silvarum]
MREFSPQSVSDVAKNKLVYWAEPGEESEDYYPADVVVLGVSKEDLITSMVKKRIAVPHTEFDCPLSQATSVVDLKKHYSISSIFKATKLYENLKKATMGNKFVVYGDPAYPLLSLLYKPFEDTTLQPYEAFFSRGMSRVRQAVECGFGKVA